jgi:hypothetical protein
MVEENYIRDEVAPSYFIEGLLYNIPPVHHGISYEDTFINSYNWLIQTD